MSGGLRLPCPVRLGSVKTGGVEAQLHLYTQQKNLHQVEKLLKKGVEVDCVNHLCQTSLYCVSLLGYTSVVELLLRHGADPNRRSEDRSTPVHAAAFSCNTGLLGKLLEAGGDLRMHDSEGRTPRHWAEYGAQEDCNKMVGFILNCVSITRSLSESHSLKKRDVKTLLDFITPVSFKKLTSKTSLSDSVHCYGYGKFCVERLGKCAGALASVPVILDSEISQAEDEALHCFTCGAFTKMTNYSWRGVRVSLKELQVDHTQPDHRQHYYHDLFLTELDFCCRLFHPHLLQLMAVSLSDDLQQNKLVYERVHVGSLYDMLYHRRAEFIQEHEVLSLILQVCETLLYLHSRSLVLRSLSSHSVVIVHPGVAKVTGLGFMGPSDFHPFSTPPIPGMLYNWAAPEVIQNRASTPKADLYSICALLQELNTGSVPWGSGKSDWIKQAVDEGHALCADPAVPQPYYDLVLVGLKHKAQERTCSLQDLRYLLRSNLRELSQREERTEVHPLPARSSICSWNTSLRQNREHEHPDEQVDHLDIIEHQEKIKTSFSNHVSNSILNLKVCKVLVQEIEPCLAVIESRIKGAASSSDLGFDEPDGFQTHSEKQGVLKAVGPPFKNYDRMYQSSEELDEHTWTSEVSAAVTQAAQGLLGAAAGAVVGSSAGEEDTKLEQLFKSLAGIESDSEESTGVESEESTEVESEESTGVESEGSTNFHTFTLFSAAQKVKGQHQTSDSEDDPDVTEEVCRPYMTAETSFEDSLSSSEEHQHPKAESLLLSTHTTGSSHMVDIADLSSITCSPAQLQEQAEQNGARPRLHSTHFPPCNSTPLSPHTHTGGVRSEVCFSPPVPHLQSLMETSSRGSAESPSHRRNDTTRPDHTDAKHHPVSSVLHSPIAMCSSQGDCNTPSSGNPEFTTAISEGRIGRTDRAVYEEEQEEEVVDTVRDNTASCSSDDPPGGAALLNTERAAMQDDDDDVLGEETEDQKEMLDNEQEAGPSDPTHTVPAVECDAVKEETKRAHSTLDEILQGFLETPEA